ncbi:MAG: NAD-dependent epimerase/dehydratase family protein [Proteobacteria bacterium]|nr:NAD-dependent epimerase/dehydratase family protein [Pseudomonadota bacterium]
MNQLNLTKILLTGGSGFLGCCLLDELGKNENYSFHLPLRENKLKPNVNYQVFPYHDLNENQDWSEALNGCEVVVHLAARVHIMKENSLDPLAEFRKTNVEGTLNLARQAAKMGIKRFIFLSSIKVNGESTALNQPFKADDKPEPKDAYAISKYEAEQGLLNIAKETQMEVVIIRPPLIYGPDVKGNFKQLLQIISKPFPLPFALIKNKRSFVGINNLISLINCCIKHPNAANQIFLVSDGYDLSTKELIEKIAFVQNKSPFLVPVPKLILLLGLTLLGKKALYQRLCSSLQIDQSKNYHLLDWTPPFLADDELKKCYK